MKIIRIPQGEFQMDQTSSFEKSYADFGLYRSFRQFKQAFSDRSDVREDMAVLLNQVAESEQRMEAIYGAPIANLSILEIGPGQGMERALYFGRKNNITTLDTDVIPFGFEPTNYLEMLRANGFGRFAKTAGREIVIGRKNRGAWQDLIKAPDLKRPTRLFGDICSEIPAQGAFDAVMSWSVFEHVADPDQALDNVLATLKPGGFFYISLHLWTCNNGHHDIRAFTGDEQEELPLWAHLRENTQAMIQPSSFLNQWRLEQWRELFNRKVPGTTEVLEKFEHPEVFGPKLVGELRDELADYTFDELLTVNAVYIGRKPT